MQIVIEIPDKDVPNKQEIIDISLHFIAGEVCECRCPYMVLPKGHGKLIDADMVCDELEGKSFSTSSDYHNAIDAVDDVPTIIEADRGRK